MAFEVEIKAHNMQVSDRLYDYITSKVEKLEKHFSSINEARVEITHAKTSRQVSDRYVAQITLWGKGFTLRSEERSEDEFAAFDIAIDKIQRRIEKYKGKRFRGRGDGVSASEVAIELNQDLGSSEVDEEPKIVRRKHFVLHPMDEVEALEQSELLGHEDFFVFFNIKTNSISVLYRRRDGDYGLIDTDLA